MTLDYQELRLRHLPTGFALDVASLTPVKSHSGAADVALANVIKSGAQQIKDWSRFYNIFNVEGKRDRRTGEPLKDNYTIWESFAEGFEDHALHIGEKRELLSKRPELDKQVDVQIAVNVLAVRNAKSGNAVAYNSSWLYPPAYVGDTITADGKDLELTRISGMSMKGITDSALSLRPRVELP